jgi:RNA polymerase sigma-70 factor (ECF subfamily)
MRSDDRHLVRRCLAGDQAAFDRLYDRHAARVYHLLRRLTAHETEAEDLMQETFLAAYRSLGAWRGEGVFGTWLCGIAFRLYANARRRHSGRETAPLDEEIDQAAPDADPLAHCLRREMAERIETAIATLPSIYREVVVLVHVEGLSCQEAASWLDVPPGTARWRLWRAIGLLQAALADRSEAPERAAAPPERKPRGEEPRRAAAASPTSVARGRSL